MNIVVDVSTSITTAPTVQRFFYNTTGLWTVPTTLTIDAADFFDDTDDPGAGVTTLPSLTTDNSYFNVC